MSTAWDRITSGTIAGLAKYVDVRNPYDVIRIGACRGMLFVADPYDDVDDEEDEDDDEDYEGDRIEAVWAFNQSAAQAEFSDRVDPETIIDVPSAGGGPKSWNYVLFRLLVEKSAKDALANFDEEDVRDYNYFAELLDTPMRLTWDPGPGRAKIRGSGQETRLVTVETPLEKLKKERRGWGKLAPLPDRIAAHQDWLNGDPNGRQLDMTGESLPGPKFRISSVNLADAVFDRADLTDVVFDGTRLRGASFEGANLQRADFDGAKLRDVSFVNADLRGADFTDSPCTNCDFTGAKMTDVRRLVKKWTRNPEKKIRHRGRR